MSIIEALEPILINFTLQDSLLSQPLDNIIAANTNCKAIIDYIHAVWLLNTLQHLVVERIFDYVIQNKGKLCVTREDQLLLYMRGEGRVGKSYVIYALEMTFTLLNRKNKLMISSLTGCLAEGIGGNTIHTALSISICKAKSLYTNVSRIWTHQSLLIIDELSMI